MLFLLLITIQNLALKYVFFRTKLFVIAKINYF